MRRHAAALLLAACGSAPACEGLRADNAWVRLPPPGVSMTAAYASLRNTSTAPLTVSGVSSPDYADVTLHRTVEDGGMSRMRPALPLAIAPGAGHELEPGGYHLMLSRPGARPVEGDEVRIEFRCTTGSALFSFTVSRDAP